jgi:hypothetical protein
VCSQGADGSRSTEARRRASRCLSRCSGGRQPQIEPAKAEGADRVSGDVGRPRQASGRVAKGAGP